MLIDPNVGKEAVVKKINAFKTNYIREKKNFEDCRHSGSGTDEICVPTLWYWLNISGLHNSFRSREIAMLLVISRVVLQLLS
jgi:hypothetical protein